LSVCRMRNVKTEYVSCPSCGRTLFDLQTVTAEVSTHKWVPARTHARTSSSMTGTRRAVLNQARDSARAPTHAYHPRIWVGLPCAPTETATRQQGRAWPLRSILAPRISLSRFPVLNPKPQTLNHSGRKCPKPTARPRVPEPPTPKSKSLWKKPRKTDSTPALRSPRQQGTCQA
jgi:hypothetical protein